MTRRTRLGYSARFDRVSRDYRSVCFISWTMCACAFWIVATVFGMHKIRQKDGAHLDGIFAWSITRHPSKSVETAR